MEENRQLGAGEVDGKLRIDAQLFADVPYVHNPESDCARKILLTRLKNGNGRLEKSA